MNNYVANYLIDGDRMHVVQWTLSQILWNDFMIVVDLGGAVLGLAVFYYMFKGGLARRQVYLASLKEKA